MNDELLKQAHKCLAIEKVILTNLTVNCHPSYDPGFSNEPLSVQYRAGPASNRKHFDLSCEDQSSTTVCRFYFNCGVRLVASSEEADEDVADDAVMYEINAEFAADYRLECKIDDEEGALSEFARYNVGYHVWPYWRELVQSCCMRAAMNVIQIPMYKIQK